MPSSSETLADRGEAAGNDRRPIAEVFEGPHQPRRTLGERHARSDLLQRRCTKPGQQRDPVRKLWGDLVGMVRSVTCATSAPTPQARQLVDDLRLISVESMSKATR
jgi:hypothetical protein